MHRQIHGHVLVNLDVNEHGHVHGYEHDILMTMNVSTGMNTDMDAIMFMDANMITNMDMNISITMGMSIRMGMKLKEDSERLKAHKLQLESHKHRA